MSAYASMSGLFQPVEMTAYSFAAKNFCFQGDNIVNDDPCSKEEKKDCFDATPDVEVTVHEARLDMQVLCGVQSNSSTKAKQRNSSRPPAKGRVRKRGMSISQENDPNCCSSSSDDKAILYELNVYVRGKRTIITRNLLDIQGLQSELQKEMTYRKLDPCFRNRPILKLPGLPELHEDNFIFSGCVGSSGFTAMRQMMLNYSPKLNRWFREVLEVVRLVESPCMTEFLTEPLWELRLAGRPDHFIPADDALDAIVEGEESEDEEEDDEC